MTTESEILSTIDVGAMLDFEFAGTGEYVCPRPLGGDTLLTVNNQPSDPTFTVTMYEFDGGWEAKISLTQAGSFWLPVAQAAGLDNPIVMGPEAGEFMLTDDGQGDISIANTVAPPDLYIQIVQGGPFPYLAYGFSSPLLNLFNISVVG
jgi:hypothetical protein